MKFLPKIFVCATLMCLCLSVQAQAKKSIIPPLDEVSRKGDMARLEQQKKKDDFTLADEDKNGALSREEVAKIFPYIDQNFDRYDKNKDGVLSFTEFGGRE